MLLLKKSLFLLTFFLFTSAGFANISVIDKEHDIDFQINPQKLTEEKIYFACDTFDNKDFQNERACKLDITDSCDIKGSIVVVTKTAFTVDVDPQVFNESFFTSEEFIKKTIVGIQSFKKMENGKLKITKISKIHATGEEIEIKGELTPFYYPNPKTSQAISETQLNQIFSLDSNLGTPEKVVVVYLTNKTGKHVHGSNIAIKVYPYNNKSLLVTYQMTNLKPDDWKYKASRFLPAIPIPYSLLKSRAGADMINEAKIAAEGFKSIARD